MIGSLTRVYSGISEKVPNYVDHPCFRKCPEKADVMTCVYNFTVEYHYVLGVECGTCPFNVTHCKKPGCIAADGVGRSVIAVNRMIPGPGIHVCLGDVVVVNVHNALDGAEGLSIHWHGLHLKGHQHMDGVTMVTQCPIAARTTFQYRFPVKIPGTHFWHAHSGLQRGDGVFGSLIVRQADSDEAHRRLYDEDLPEHTIHVQDWLLQPTVNRLAGHQHGVLDNNPQSILINGQGSFQSFMYSIAGQIRRTPHAEFSVSQNTSYRFRVISNGVLNCPIRLSVDNHTLLMVATDGAPFDSVEVKYFNIFAGERYDFVLNATSRVDSYWIRAKGLGNCGKKKVREFAILKYKGSNITIPAVGRNVGEDSKEVVLNPVNDDVIDLDSVLLLTDLNSTLPDDVTMKEQPDIKLYVAMDFNSKVTRDLSHGDVLAMGHTMRGMHHAHFPQLNGISFVTPPSPPLSQLRDIPEELFCNADTLKMNCSTHYCKCIHRLVVGVGATVEMVIVDEGKMLNVSHPMHLHGHNFRVVAMDKLGASTSMEEVKRLDREGLIRRRLSRAVIKDTVAVPDGGYVVIRFVADNPGMWLFHCHIAFHLVTGMQLLLQVGQPDQLPTTPANFPRCGNWRYTEPGATEPPRKNNHNGRHGGDDDGDSTRRSCAVCSGTSTGKRNDFLILLGVGVWCFEQFLNRMR
ncbi:L-ascorbate oxidase-like [Gigantopelta aegis]|uniref:L-ascorbate oxidase-like n=1 Tax=Gigantopelta aegis TaxID=1735272 RepID=UPI001B88CFA5|nr:L-ascorbate oxidase-like [Gigantopelta aegis]